MIFDEASLDDGDPAFKARAHVLSVSAGGVPQAFEAPPEIAVGGSYGSGALATGFFGPIRVGNAGLLLDLEGTALDGARRVPGPRRSSDSLDTARSWR